MVSLSLFKISIILIAPGIFSFLSCWVFNDDFVLTVDFVCHWLNSNADRTSWWELMVLSTHVHPSVATMAATLLSGANIVYNGNPLNDLSLTAFLDKFMEKKPKASSWHGGSQIEPSKKVSLNFSFKDLLL